jgi:bifunctional non-homologous end joining protein LigD
MEGHQPEWATIYSMRRIQKAKGKRDIIDYLVCNNEATLQYIINLGCIDVNPWTSRTASPEHPDYVVIDLDPSDEDFKKAIETAKAAKEFFDQHKLIAFPKTSGKTGIHLYLPCEGFTFPEARKIAETVCKGINKLVPAITTTQVNIASRGDKLYLDPNQNDFADTVAAPYSVRPFKQLQISTPLEWQEINDRLDPANFSIKVVLNRLKRKGDLWSDLLSQNNIKKNVKALKTFLL